MAPRNRQSSPSTPTPENTVQSALKDPVVKWIIRIILIIVLLFIGFIFVMAISGRHVKILGFEVNSPKPADTIYKERIIAPPTESAKETTKVITPVIYSPGKPKENKVKDTTPTIKAKNVNTGTNQGIIGDNATLNVTDQPVFTEDDKKIVLEKVQELRKKADSSLVLIFTGAGSNAGQFISDMGSFLRKNGYVVEQAMSLGSYTGVHFDVGPYMDNKTQIIEIYVGNIK